MKTLGQIAYEAFATQIVKPPEPYTWEELHRDHPKTPPAWEVAAAAIAEECAKALDTFSHGGCEEDGYESVVQAAEIVRALKTK